MQLLRLTKMGDITSRFTTQTRIVVLCTLCVALLPAGLIAFYPSTVLDHVMPKQVYRHVKTRNFRFMNCLDLCELDEDCSSYNVKYDLCQEERNCELSKCAIGEGRKGQENDLLYKEGFLFQQIRPTKNKSLCRTTEKEEKGFNDTQKGFNDTQKGFNDTQKGFNNTEQGFNNTEKEKKARGLEASTILKYGGNIRQYLVDLSSFLNNGTTRNRTWRRCYHAGDEGLNAARFHSNCDLKGPTITIVRVDKYVFGGYLDKSWGGSCKWLKSTETFLFSLYNKNGYQPHRFNITSKGTSTAVYDCMNGGPSFGVGSDLKVNAKGIDSYAVCLSYDVPPGCTYSVVCPFYTGKSHFSPNELEVFYETKINS